MEQEETATENTDLKSDIAGETDLIEGEISKSNKFNKTIAQSTEQEEPKSETR